MEGPAPASSATEERPVEQQQVAPPKKRPLKRSTRIGLTVIGILTVIAILAFSGTYFFYSRNYVSTDNAQVDGDKITITAPASGYLTDWTGAQGTQVKKEQVLGRIKMTGGFVASLKAIRSPGAGTIAVDNGIEGSFVTVGTQLAAAYNLESSYVTARVEETDVDEVRVGAPVDIAVDAFPGAEVTGRVVEIQNSAATQFDLFPEQNSSGNFQKETQMIPVKIALTSTAGRPLLPGMNVTVQIHKH
ncbi:MAG TPA: efflux RND transporter periplasmic adaptor subunit [Pseudonocardia sp.]|jgi:multidrug resistance efflux pump|nr:efflux RND transporter periplasmic adaptor subunit [Pseudonocardia sp.]